MDTNDRKYLTLFCSKFQIMPKYKRYNNKYIKNTLIAKVLLAANTNIFHMYWKHKQMQKKDLHIRQAAFP